MGSPALGAGSIIDSLSVQSPPAPLQSHASFEHPLRGCLDKEGRTTGGRSDPVEAHSKRRTCTPKIVAFSLSD